MTTHVEARPGESSPARSRSLGGLRGPAGEARARLRPERPVVPAPRSPGGVTPPPELRRDPDAPAADLVAAVDALDSDLAALEGAPDPGADALARIAELVAAGMPERGWSTGEGLDVDALVAASGAAATLRAAATAVLERLDAEDRGSPAAAVDALVGSLRVIGMVADLEVFARSV